MNKHQVVIINGNGGVGKDTFINALKIIARHRMTIWNYSSVDKIKEIAKMIGWDGNKDEKSRKLLSDLKALCDNYNNLTFEAMQSKVDEFKRSDASILFLHIREPHNIEAAKIAFDAETVLVTRDAVEQITSNDSDKNVAEYDYDFIVNNDGDISDLGDECDRFLQYLDTISAYTL